MAQLDDRTSWPISMSCWKRSAGRFPMAAITNREGRSPRSCSGSTIGGNTTLAGLTGVAQAALAEATKKSA